MKTLNLGQLLLRQISEAEHCLTPQELRLIEYLDTLPRGTDYELTDENALRYAYGTKLRGRVRIYEMSAAFKNALASAVIELALTQDAEAFV